DEIAKRVVRPGCQRVFGKLDDQIRRTELPAVIPRWRRWSIAAISFWRAFTNPLREQFDVAVSETTLADKRTTRVGFPRRHGSGLDGVENCRCARTDILVRHQTERCRSVRVMTIRAVAVQNRRDVPSERSLCR